MASSKKKPSISNALEMKVVLVGAVAVGKTSIGVMWVVLRSSISCCSSLSMCNSRLHHAIRRARHRLSFFLWVLRLHHLLVARFTKNTFGYQDTTIGYAMLVKCVV